MKKIILLVASYILCLDSVFSQEIEWQNTIGGNGSDGLTTILQTSDGGYLLGGSSDSDISGDKTENNFLTGSDYWVIKTDANGNIQWQNTIGGEQPDGITCAQQTWDNGYILGGISSSGIYGDKTEGSMGMSDYWIVKIDSVGNIQWQSTIGADEREWLYSIQQTTDGGFILGGYSESDSSGDKSENNAGLVGWHIPDYWVVKVDSAGNIQWENSIGGSERDELYSIFQSNDGGYVCGGWSQSSISGDKTENSLGGKDYWVVKLDSSGNIQWQNTIGGSGHDDLKCIKQTADGGIILAGTSTSSISGDKTENSMGLSDCWLVKLNSMGSIQWQNTIGGNNQDGLNALSLTADGGFICGAFSNSGISGDKTENIHGGYDYWAIKIDSIGNIQWQNSIGGNDYDNLTSIQQVTDGYILGGYSRSNASGEKIENCMGTDDYWIVKLDNKSNLIDGKLFIDLNSNQIQDVSEPIASHKQITEINTGRFAFTEQNGHFNVSILDSGIFSVYPATINYYNPVPATHNAYFSGFQQTDYLNDFAFQPAGVFNDLCVTITPLSTFRANMNASYIINYENVGTTTLSPTVIFFPDTSLTFISSFPIVSSVTTDSAVWNFGPLAPFQTGSILVTINVNTGIPAGTLINSTVEIDPIAGDANTACNFADWPVLTTGSYDPNIILVNKNALYTTQFPNPPFLEYIINFQNTGNDTAFTVKILNPIDTFKMQLNTLEFVASSNTVNMNWIPWERNMEFKFDNILLPDSNVNEPASHGFVRYRIKPKTTLVAGDSIKNTAYIYFDFNAPVQTDTAVTEIVLPTGEEEFNVQSLKLKVFPNPAKDELIISSNKFKEKGSIRIYDLFGREVFQLQTRNQEPETKIDVSGFSQGVYIIEMGAGEKLLRGKFVKQ